MPFDPDTALGGRGDRFPSTRQSVLVAASQGDTGLRHEALASLIEAYWKPVYKYIRVQWRKSNEEAKDLTQSFFAQLLERDLIERFDPARAPFRTYLRVCVDGLVQHEAEAAGRLKRGGGFAIVPLDFEAAEHELKIASQPELSMEEYFHREWQRQLFALAVEDLRVRCRGAGKQIQFELFEEYDLADARPTYEELAQRHHLTATTVTNYLAWARRELRRLLLERLSAITAGRQEFQREARNLMRGSRGLPS